MDDLDRPDIGPHVFEQIEVEMHDQDKRYWPQLLAMQMPTPVMELAFTVLAQPSPRAPQLPSRLSVILHSYAQSLFYVEASKYPPVDSRLRHWLTKLAERIESRIMRSVREIEAKAIMTSLAYHGVSESQMRQVIAEALQQMIAKFAREERSQKSISAPTAPIQLAKSSPTPQGHRTKEKRRAFIEPLLREKGWSPLDWANEANVAYHTAADYLSGARNPTRSSRAKLANALGVNPNLLPD